MTKFKVIAAYVIIALLLPNMIILSAMAEPLFIGATETKKADIKESADVNSSQPNTPITDLWVSSDGAYAYIKTDLAKLPPIDEILIISAYLEFVFRNWSASGEWGYVSLAAHYCEDDSWTHTTLTWNNKPSFNSEATDTWGFSIIHMGEQLGFNIEADVIKTLESGDTLLTEVIKWNSGDGHTKLSSPELTVVYARKPIYNVLLNAVSDVPNVNITQTPLVSIKIADQTFNTALIVLPKLEYASSGTYTLEFQGRCKFLGWEPNGGISVLNSSNPQTKITIASDGELTAICSLEWAIYGDEEEANPSDLYQTFNSSESYAEKYTPVVTGYLRLLRVYITDNPAPFELHILGMSEDPTQEAPVDIATPVTITPTGKGWAEINLTSQEIRVEKDQPYYLSITWLSDGEPVFGEAITTLGRDTYRFRNNAWEKFFADIITQHIVSTSLEEPVKFLPYAGASAGVPDAWIYLAVGAATLGIATSAIGFSVYRITKRRRLK
jgi:hypothetical protein